MYLFQIIDEGVFKAGEERSETRGAAEVQEDEDTQVEIPVDQVATMPLKRCVNKRLPFSSKFCGTLILCRYVKPSRVARMTLKIKHLQFFLVFLQRGVIRTVFITESGISLINTTEE